MVPRPHKRIQWPSSICGLILTTLVASATDTVPLPLNSLARFGSLQCRHGGWITSVEFLDNGRVVVSAGTDGCVRFWDFLTGEQIRKHDFGNVATIALSPNRKQLAVAANSDSSVQVWDVKKWQQVVRFPLPTIASFRRPIPLAWSLDGKQIAGGVFLNVWNVDLKEMRRFRNGALESLMPLKQVAFLSGGNVIGMGDDSGELAAVDPVAGKLRWHMERYTRQIAIAPGGRVLARQDSRFAIRLLDLRDGNKEVRVFQLNKTAGAITFSPDGRFLAAGSVDGLIHLWSLTSGKKVRVFTTGERINALTFSPNCRVLASAGWDGVVRFWEFDAGGEIHPNPAHRGMISSIAITGKTLVSGSRDGSICIWDTKTNDDPRRIHGHRKSVRCVDIDPIRRRFVSAGDDGKIRIWDRDSGRLLRELPGHNWRGKVAFSPDGKRLAGAMLDVDGYIRVGLWDANTWRLMERLGRYSASVSCLAFSPDGKRAAIASFSYPSFAVWDVVEGRKLPSPFDKLKKATVVGAVFTKGGKSLIANSSNDRVIESFDIDSGRPIRRYFGLDKNRGPERVIALSSDGKILAVGDGDDVVLLQVTNGKVIRRFNGHEGPVTALVWGHDNATLYSGSQDGTILQWDVSGQRRPLPTKPIKKHWDSDSVRKLLAIRKSNEAYRGIAMLVAHPDKGVALLADHLRPAESAKPSEIRQWIEKLSSRRFIIRQQATKALIEMGPQIKPTLQKFAASPQSLEMRRRIHGILASFDQIDIPPDELRVLRAIDALELIAAEPAREVLRKLTTGAAGARVTVAANAALQRLDAGP